MEIKKAIEAMRVLHLGQADKQGVTYWKHPLRVMLRLGPNASKAERIAALFHDVAEDCHVNFTQLFILGLDAGEVGMVRCLTKEEGMNYLAYIDSLCVLHGDVGDSVRKIKLADNYDNTCPSRPLVDKHLIKRYKNVREKLRTVMPDEISRQIFCGDIPEEFVKPFYDDSFDGDMTKLNWGLLFPSVKLL